jgi:S1-C subfamily serine protease
MRVHPAATIPRLVTQLTIEYFCFVAQGRARTFEYDVETTAAPRLGKKKAKDRQARPRLIPVSKFPVQQFKHEKSDASAPHSYLALRLVIDLFTPQARAIGSATVIGAGLLATAKHVIEDLFVGLESDKIQATKHGLHALQVLPGGANYVIWPVTNAEWINTADLALLKLNETPLISYDLKQRTGLVLPRINALEPQRGATVAAFGYRLSKVSVDPTGQHTTVDDEAMTSTGTVRKIYPDGRDRTFMPYPCYQVSARFDAGMSGGPVIDESGALCGIVSSGIQAADDETGEPISYAAILWPLFTMPMGAKHITEHQEQTNSKDLLWERLRNAKIARDKSREKASG